MSIRYEQAHPEDYEALIDLGNYCFSASHAPHDFKRLLPKEYDSHPECAAHHLVARDERGLRAMVAVRPGEQIILGQALTYGYVGTVCAHMYDRGLGYMSHLVPMAVERARAQGLDYLSLGGERARYAHFGFEPGGIKPRFTLLSKALPAADGIEISMLKGDTVPEDVYALYARQPVRVTRTRDEYMTIARSWAENPYEARLNGKLVATLTGGEGTVTELITEQPALAPRVLRAWCDLQGQSDVTLYVAPWTRELVKTLSDVCNHGEPMHECGRFHILRYAPVIRALLTLKASYTPLAPGRVTLSIEDAPRAISVEMDEQGRVTVTETDEPGVPLSHRAAHELLLAPITALYPPSSMPAGWFPLPACLFAPDQF